MFWMNTKRIVKYGFINFWRNGFVTLASILIITVTLFIMGSLIFLGAILDSSLDQIKNKVDINVYFVTTAPEEDIISLKSSLEQLSEVSLVEYVSREQAIGEFKKRHENDQLILQALQELDDNPLGSHFNIRAKETSQYESIATFLENYQTSSSEISIVDKVNFFQNKIAIEKLSNIILSVDKLSLGVIVAFMIISILIIFNTIRLAIYTSREEISVMKLVGAGNFYVRGPFVIEGIMYGISSALIALALFYPVTIWMAPLTENFFGGANVFNYYVNNFAQIFVVLILSGVFLGGVSSYLAVKKYLKI